MVSFALSQKPEMPQSGSSEPMYEQPSKHQFNGAPGAIPTRDLPLRSRIYEPFVFNSYEKA
jgi:hypothetical protein